MPFQEQSQLLSLSHREYRAAIALNNIGVTLLERRCFKQALATLQDAVVLMKIAFLPPTAAFSKDVVAKLQKAHERVACPRPCSQTAPIMRFQVISDDGDTSVLFENTTTEKNSLACALLVRFEDVTAFGDRCCDIDSSVILHNFGQSCLLYSKTMSSSVFADRLRQNSFAILNLCQQVLLSCFFQCREDDVLKLQKVFFVSVVVTQTLSQALAEETNMAGPLGSCLAKLSNLKAALRELSRFDSIVTSLQIAAAA
jgi:hypothetical protein